MSTADHYTCQYIRTAAVCPVCVAQHKAKVHIVPILSFLHIYTQLLRLGHVC